MRDHYRFRRAESIADAGRLKTLFTSVFYPEPVGILAETMFNHLPHMQNKYWFIAEEKKSGTIAAAFALIPWTWCLAGISLKVAEMGIVGTLAEHRGQGLMRILNQEFDQTLAEEQFDLAIIQGIPAFYDKFGYHFAVPLENHINLPLHSIPNRRVDDQGIIRLATLEDIPFLMDEDSYFNAAFSLSAIRDEANWRYLLTDSLKTEYGSEIWIVGNQESGQKYYFRIPHDGFGEGLILSELSEGVNIETFELIMAFCKQKAVEREKPYIRLNLHNDSSPGKMAIAMGATKGEPYAWQIKIPDITNSLTTITPLLEERLQLSSFKNYDGRFRLDFFKSQIDLVWEGGKIIMIQPGKGDCEYKFAMNINYFPALCLGHRTWQELRYVKPDIFPANGNSALFIEVLFPIIKSWIHEQY